MNKIASPFRPAMFFGLLSLLVALAGCESTHEVYGDNAPQDVASDTSNQDSTDPTAESPDDIVTDDGVDSNDDADQPPISEIDCSEEDGVTVSGEIHHSGDISEYARLWIVWMADADDPGMPACFGEVLPVEFPARFRVINAPRGGEWDLEGLLDMDGFFPPMPIEGDYFAIVRNEDLGGLAEDVSEVVIDLQPFVP